MSLARTTSSSTTLTAVSQATTLVPERAGAAPAARKGIKAKLRQAFGGVSDEAVATLVGEGFSEADTRAALKTTAGDAAFARRMLVHQRDHAAAPTPKTCFLCRPGGDGAAKANTRQSEFGTNTQFW
ncbi:uncharacterized protein LOC62_02G003434 [Vanrija pseudolonga]|uniref:UBA domain-containing protein n=1 Tax=Vanrija pseudolonga TaxID=143232 RepID=A0AAF1BJJ5_9TREE|nr:hypothetical protein LOC62_02G003434 [Vanrija pseudolonga]